MTERGRSVSKKLRQQITEQAKGLCEYYKYPEDFASQHHSVEHIQPCAHGGKTASENLALSCQGCNNFKAAKTQAQDPQTGELVRLFHPRQDQWKDHFGWSADGSAMEGADPDWQGYHCFVATESPATEKSTAFVRQYWQTSAVVKCKLEGGRALERCILAASPATNDKDFLRFGRRAKHSGRNAGR